MRIIWLLGITSGVFTGPQGIPVRIPGTGMSTTRWRPLAERGRSLCRQLRLRKNSCWALTPSGEQLLIISVSTITCKNCAGRLQKNFYVKPYRPAASVLQVQPNHFVETGAAPAFDLPKAGYSGFDL